jgi:hypothetical protein
MRSIRRKSLPVKIVVASSTTIGTLVQNYSGLLLGINIVVPALDASATITVTVVDPDGNIIYTKSALAASSTSINTPLATSIPLYGDMVFKVTASAAQSTDKSITVIPIVDSYN